jgi:hypothetical protein
MFRPQQSHVNLQYLINQRCRVTHQICCLRRVPFVYVYIVVIYASWLLRYHYKVTLPTAHHEIACELVSLHHVPMALRVAA